MGMLGCGNEGVWEGGGVGVWVCGWRMSTSRGPMKSCLGIEAKKSLEKQRKNMKGTADRRVQLHLCRVCTTLQWLKSLRDGGP